MTLNLASRAIIALLIVCRRRRARKHRWWIHPVISNRKNDGLFYILHTKLREFPEKFYEFYRMSQSSFDYLVTAVGQHLEKKDTYMRDSIKTEQKLSVTLRYLATGCSLHSLYFEYLIGRRTLSVIIEETCKAIWCVLKEEYMKELIEEDWVNISDKFKVNANFPHCVGAIDGKHIRVVKPHHSGSNFFNYKHFYSIIMMAIADAGYCFSYIDIGAFGKMSDSNVLKSTSLGKAIYSGKLHLPQSKALSNDLMNEPAPFVFVADEAFALCRNVLKPFPSRDLTMEKRVFNYRLCRARRYVECAFGIMSNKWRILHRPLDVRLQFADTIIKSCCILHNFVRKRDGYNFDDSLHCVLDDIPNRGLKATANGINVRNIFMKYFCTKEGSLPWQYKYA